MVVLFSGCGKAGEVPIGDESTKHGPIDANVGYGSGKIVVCGSNKVYIINLKNSTSRNQDIEWEWSADKATDVPAQYRTNYYKNIDECKPSRDGKRLYITASGGGVAVINIADKKVLFYAYVPQAHSIEELPGNKVAVISSTHDQGNAIDLFSISKNEMSLFREEFISGHGLVWHLDREILFAWGGRELRAYSLEDVQTDHPSLVLQEKYYQPGTGGHDLSFMADSSALILTDTQNVWSFHIENKIFSAYKFLSGYKNVKSVSVNRTDNRILFMSPEESWWAFHVRILDPYNSIPMPEMKVYKARWFMD